MMDRGGPVIVHNAYIETIDQQFIIDHSHDLVSVIDRDYTYRFINAAYSRIYDRKPEHILGSTVAELWGRDKFDLILRGHLVRCFAGEQVYDQAWIDCGASGERFFDIAYIPHAKPGGAVDGVVVISHDITELKRTQERLMMSEAHYRSLVEHSLDLIFTIELDGTIRFANPAAQTVFVPSKNLLFIVHREDLERTRDALDQLMAGQAVHEFEIRAARENGEMCYLALNASLLPAEGRAPAQSLVIARDITRDKRIEHVIREAGLTPRETEILRFLARGFTNLNIASRLDIRESTVKFHVNRIFRKTNTQSRTELVSSLH